MDPDEDKAQHFLVERGLVVERFSKVERRQTKTPDSRAFKEGQLAFCCEVKTVAEDVEFERRLDSSVAGTLIGKGGEDPTLNRVERKIYEAVDQFRAVDPKREIPRVLLFVRRDWSSGPDCLSDVLAGCFPANDGSRDPIYAKYSEGKIQAKRREIVL